MTLERAKIYERSQTTEWHNARVVPFQMENPDHIRRQMLDQLKNTGYLDPSNFCLTLTYVVLKDNHSHTPYTFNLAGGHVNPDPDEFKRKKSVLQKLASAMHVFGVHASDLTRLVARKPFSWNDDRGVITSHDTIYATELPVGFKPLAINPETAHHEFLAVTPDQLRVAFDTNEILTPDGRSFSLIGNLRGSAKSRRKDHHLIADPDDVNAARNSILGALDQFEAQIRQEVVLTMLDMEDNVEDERRVMHPDVIAYWKAKLGDYKLTDSNSRDQFERRFHDFLELYDRVNEEYLSRLKTDPDFRTQMQPQLTDTNVDDYVVAIREQARKRKLYHLANQFYKASNYVFMNRATKFNRRLPVQGAFFMGQAPRKLGQISAANIKEMTKDVDVARQPDYFARFMSFAFEAMEAGSINELYLKLREYRSLKIVQGSRPIKSQDQESYNRNLLIYETKRRHIYETFARYFIPEYDIYKDLPEEKKMKIWQRFYAHHSQLNDDAYTTLTVETLQLASDPSIPLALEQLEDVTVDQLDEHLLGSFNLNPYGVEGSESVLADHYGFEYRRKLLGVIILISEAIPQYEDQIAENTYFIRNVIKHLARKNPDTGQPEPEWSAFLVVDKKTKRPALIPESTPAKEKSGQILTTVSIIPIRLEVDGEILEFNIFYRFRTKNDIRVFAKSISRDDRPSTIFDVTAFTIGIDDSSLQRQFASEGEKRAFTRRLVYLVEEKFKQTAKDCRYDYAELDDDRHARKDRLAGDESIGGSGASIPLSMLKSYPVLSINTALGTQSQTQELQYFPGLSAYAADWLDYLARYRASRLVTPKLKITPDGTDAYMTSPTTYVLYPPQYPVYRGSYIDLMQPHDLSVTSRWRTWVLKAEKRLRELITNET